VDFEFLRPGYIQLVVMRRQQDTMRWERAKPRHGRSSSATLAVAAWLLSLIVLVSTGSHAQAHRQGKSMRDVYQGVLRRDADSAEQLQTVMEQQPYVSVVLVMRNDDYGGNLLHRFERTIADLAEAHSQKSPTYVVAIYQ
jgi:hypothetical protein